MSAEAMLRVASEYWALYELDASPGQRWVAFVLPPGDPSTAPGWGFLPVASVWPLSAANRGLPAFTGYWVFAPARPANPADFVARLWQAASGLAFQGLTLPLWLADADAATLNPVFLATVPGISNTIGSSTGLGFGGNFTFAVPTGSGYALSNDSSALEITANGRFSLQVNNYPAYGFDPTLSLVLVGAAAGCLVLDANLSFDPSPNGADLGLHYAFAGAQKVHTLSYPLFDIGAAGPKLDYAVSLDPSAPYDTTRTQLGFKAGAPALPSGLQSPIGQQVMLQPLSGAALVIRSLFGTNVAGGTDSCLEPDGPFGVTLAPVTPDGSAQVMPGFSGTETLSASATMRLTFQAGAAYCPFDPTSATPSAEALALNDMGGQALTAWAVADAQPVQYCSQPVQSAFFQNDAALADGFFQAATMGLSDGTALPALPLAAYGLLAPSTSYEVASAFEHYVLAPARSSIFQPLHKAAMRRALAAPAATGQTYLTGRGLVVDAVGAAFSQIVLAVTTDSAGGVHTWTLTSIGPALSAALSANQCFVVATRSQDLDEGTLFAFQDGVAFADWLLTADVPQNGAGATLILKYGPQSVAQLAGQLASWTDAATFNADPAAAQSALQVTLASIAAGAGSSNPQLAALYAPMQQRLTDPTWNGLLVLQPTVATLPAVVAGIVAAGAAGALPALALGVAFSDVAGGGAAPPTLKGSAPFGLIDFENPPDAATAASGYRFAVTDIRAQFENASLTSFSALARLEINTLFGLPVALQTGQGGDAPFNDIVISGTYQAPASATAPGVYSFAATAPANFRFAYEFYNGQLLAELLNTIQLETIQFAPINAGSGAASAVSRFDLGGSLSFWPPAAAGASQPPLLLAADLFDFNSLGFSGLGLVVTGSGSAANWLFDVSRAVLTVDATGLRPGLLTDLPLQPVRLAASGSVAALGLAAPQVPTGWSPSVDSFDFAFVYRLNLGKPGAFAPSTQSLTATVVTGWQANGAYALGFGIDGLSQSAAINLQGVMQLGVDSVALGPFTTDQGQRLGLSLLGCSLGFLGTNFPAPSDGFSVALVAPPPYPATSLMWFGSHPAG